MSASAAQGGHNNLHISIYHDIWDRRGFRAIPSHLGLAVSLNQSGRCMNRLRSNFETRTFQRARFAALTRTWTCALFLVSMHGRHVQLRVAFCRWWTVQHRANYRHALGADRAWTRSTARRGFAFVFLGAYHIAHVRKILSACSTYTVARTSTCIVCLSLM